MLELREHRLERGGGWGLCGGVVLCEEADKMVDVFDRLVSALAKVLYTEDKGGVS